ncbi:hypothetical protein [Micromonospora aurantiaca (nom. illeg.)]|uniref:hypothetical protein n=1 Tax=Micromonospora aurantiaca (nom. illeg.) TaxID=47850 RepID=UPI0033CE75B2
MADLVDDVARLVHPPVLPRPDASEAEREAIEQINLDEEAAREATVADLRRRADQHGVDPLLYALKQQVEIRDGAAQRIRMLVAYARECVTPRPYPVEWLAEVMKGSNSTVRGAFDHRVVEQVTSLTGRRSTVAQIPADDARRRQLVAALEAHTLRESAREHVAGVAEALRQQGFTAYPPVPRTANPKHARLYVRHARTWPNGTTVSLYQEPAGFLAVHGHMADDDPRWYSQTYGIIDGGESVTAADIAESLAAYVERVTRYDADKITR